MAKKFIERLIANMAGYSKSKYNLEIFAVLKMKLASFECPKNDVAGNPNFVRFWSNTQVAIGSAINAAEVKEFKSLPKERTTRKFQNLRRTAAVQMWGAVHRKNKHG
jgi:hypothetical protein